MSRTTVFLVHGSTCARSTYCLAVLYVRHKGRHFSSEGLVQAALVHKGNQGHTRCLFMFNVTWTNPASKETESYLSNRCFRSYAASILSPRHTLTPSSNTHALGPTGGIQLEHVRSNHVPHRYYLRDTSSLPAATREPWDRPGESSQSSHGTLTPH